MSVKRSKIRFTLVEPVIYLVENEEVFTIRPSAGKPVDETKVNIYYKDVRIGKGVKVFIGTVARFWGWKVIEKNRTVHDLSEYVDKSGFKSVKDWIKAVIRVNRKIPQLLQLYHVKVEEFNGEKEELIKVLEVYEQ